MQSIRWSFSLPMILMLSGIASAIDVDNPPTGVFADEWYVIMLQGQKCGHMHVTMERIKNPGGDIIKTDNNMRMVVARGQIPIAITLEKTSRESLSGKPLAFENTMNMSRMEIIKKGIIRDGKVHATISQFGQETKHTYKLPEGAIMEWATYRQQIKRGLKPGTRYRLDVYEPTVDFNSLIPTTVEMLAEDTIDLFGRKVQTVKAKSTATMTNPLSGKMEIASHAWFNREGDVLKMEMQVMNIPVQVLACAKSVAMAKDDPADLMIKSFIVSNKPIDADKVPQVTYRLDLKNPEAADTLENIPETGLQKIVNKEKHTVTLTVTKRSARKQPGPKQKLSEKERKSYLAPSTSVNYKDPVIAKLAKQAAGNEKDPRKLADRLRKFVSDYVEDKNLSVGFATASEVARSKEGDCTEHGILLAALGRAVGIPTRVIMGMVYVEQVMGQKNIFGGHMWTQFWIDGEWVDLDAAQQQTDVKPTHIALIISNPGDANIADLVSSILLNLHKLKITVLQSR
ncbi:MAG: transglutaminase domain-containing protein [Planctomycetota bacterium]|nr:MAG: transglutaminase domain-containing protein [Planctomycetota bacterium]